MNWNILGFIQQTQNELIDELSIKVNQLSKGVAACDQLAEKHGLSRNVVSVLYAVIREELFDSSGAMLLDGTAYQLKLPKQSTRKYVKELLDAGPVVQAEKRPMKMRVSESMKRVLGMGALFYLAPMETDGIKYRPPRENVLLLEKHFL